MVNVHQTCVHYANGHLIHKIVQHTAEHVYPNSLTAGFDQQPLTNGSSTFGGAGCRSPPTKSFKSTTNSTASDSSTTTASTTPLDNNNNNNKNYHFTLEHLRNMELLVVARVLSRPEPKQGGYFVSKSWCKTALQWLELQQDASVKQQAPKKLSKKKQRLRQRRLSEVSTPWPNVNSDILCEHQNLQRCSSGKSARARRRLLDKQAWKILKKLYPDSTQLESAVGECLHCTLEAETVRKTERDLAEQLKLERKRPLEDKNVRRFYTRTRGVPVHCLRPVEPALEKMPARQCPLLPGIYHLIPRAWCHGWRRFIKTGESCVSKFPAPDAASLLCDAHRLPLLPPHLEAYLYGESPHLMLASTAGNETESVTPTVAAASAATTSPHRPFVPGQAPDLETLQALRAAGLSEAEVASQLTAMRGLEVRSNHAAAALVAAASPAAHSKNELLDRENHSVVELLTEEEFSALVANWPPQASVFCLCVAVDDAGVSTFSTPRKSLFRCVFEKPSFQLFHSYAPVHFLINPFSPISLIAQPAEDVMRQVASAPCLSGIEPVLGSRNRHLRTRFVHRQAWNINNRSCTASISLRLSVLLFPIRPTLCLSM